MALAIEEIVPPAVDCRDGSAEISPGNPSMISDALLLSLILCAILSILALKFKNQPMMLISSIGLLICATMAYRELSEILPTIILIFIAFSQFLILRSN